MLLHVIASPRPDGQSRSRAVGRAFVEGWRSAHASAEVVEQDLFEMDLPMVDATDANARIHQLRSGNLEGEEAQRFQRFMHFIEPLLECKTVVVTTPMWNFGPPWKLKQWIDTVVQARVTFQYGKSGPEGLLTGKTAALVGSSGGEYPEGDPRQTRDFLTTYMRQIFSWIGIEDPQVCLASGLDAKSDQKDEILESAKTRARELGASL